LIFVQLFVSMHADTCCWDILCIVFRVLCKGGPVHTCNKWLIQYGVAS
jgi:hypothetical protein